MTRVERVDLYIARDQLRRAGQLAAGTHLHRADTVLGIAGPLGYTSYVLLFDFQHRALSTRLVFAYEIVR